MALLRSTESIITLRGKASAPGHRGRHEALNLLWQANVRPGQSHNEVTVASFRVSVAPLAGEPTRGLELGLLEWVAHKVQDQIKSELQSYLNKARQREDASKDFQQQIATIPNIDDRLTILRHEYERRRRLGELAGEGAGFRLSDASAQAGLTVAEILDLEEHGLFVSARSVGGQRRFTEEDIAHLRKIAVTSRTSDGSLDLSRVPRLLPHPDDSDVSSAAPEDREKLQTEQNSSITPAEFKKWTMVTVVQLYLEACDRYPRRDRSVIEYIREQMPWLDEDYVVTLIRLARRKGIELPIYRRGRIPKRTGVAQRAALLNQDEDPKS